MTTFGTSSDMTKTMIVTQLCPQMEESIRIVNSNISTERVDKDISNIRLESMKHACPDVQYAMLLFRKYVNDANHKVANVSFKDQFVGNLFFEYQIICQQFISDYHSKMYLSKREAIIAIYTGFASSKHINASFLKLMRRNVPKSKSDGDDDDYGVDQIWKRLSRNPALTIGLILEFPDFPWDTEYINKHININDIKLINQAAIGWPFTFIGDNPNLTMDMMMELPNNALDWYSISMHSGITMSDIQSHLELPWDWTAVSANPHLTMNMILAHPDQDWNWEWCSENPGIAMVDIQSHLEFPWNWIYISRNPNLTMNMIVAHPDKACSNPGITTLDIERNMHFPWHCIMSPGIQI